MTTYLQLINAVLRKLRESEVSAIGSDEYVDLIGDFVNDARTQVAQAWTWLCLRDTLTVNAVDGTASYALTNWGDQVVVEQVLVTQAGYERRLYPTTNTYVEHMNNSAVTVEEQCPTKWVLSSVDSNGDVNITFYPTPDTSYTIDVTGYHDEAALALITDTTALPAKPIVDLAVAMAARERGEVGGQTATELFAVASRSLSDAIALDSAMNPLKTDWVVD